MYFKNRDFETALRKIRDTDTLTQKTTLRDTRPRFFERPFATKFWYDKNRAGNYFVVFTDQSSQSAARMNNWRGEILNL